MKKYFVYFSVLSVLLILGQALTGCLSDGDETVSLEFANVKKMIVGEWVLESNSGTPRVLTFTDDGYYTDSSDGGTKKHPWRLSSDYSDGQPYYGGIYLDGVYYDIVSWGDGHWRLKDRNGKIFDFSRDGITNSGEDSDVSKLIISSNSVSLKRNESTTIEITSGSGSYSLTNSNPEYATAELNSSMIRITAVTVGSTTITVKDKKNNQTVTIKVTVIDKEDNSQAKAVDLGLPSKTLWASCNVGASKPEEYGDYFAWGETKPKEDYSWSTYKWCAGAGDKQTKYCNKSDYGNNGFTDNKTELDLEDDAAYVNWGSQWRMPSLAQQDELREECTWEWTTRNGVNGYRVTGKNGNSIFLPAAGDRRNTSIRYAGSGGYYWSRTLTTSRPDYAYYLYFNSGSEDWGYGYRYDGQSVRPVRR